MTKLFTIAWTSIIAKCFVAIGFVPATRYQQYLQRAISSIPLAHVFWLHLVLAKEKVLCLHLP
jgi:hypothetical protein